MEGTATSGTLEPGVARLLESFSVDPSDADAFGQLESLLSERRQWSLLAGVYECRLSVLARKTLRRRDVLLRLGSLLEEQLGDRSGAERRLREAAQERRRDPEPLQRLRRFLTRSGEFTQALQVAEAEQRLEKGPQEKAKLLTEIAPLWEKLGDSDEAAHCLQRALELDPGCEAARELAALGVGGASDPDALAALADRARRRGDPDEERRVLVALERALAGKPARRRRCLVRLGEVALEAGGGDALGEATAWFEQANSLGADAETRMKLAELYERDGRLEDLGRLLRVQMEEEPARAPEIRVELARVLERAGKREEALEILRAAWEASPEAEGVAERLESLLADLDRIGELADLLLERAARISDRARALSLATRAAELLLREMGRPAEAAEALRGHVKPGAGGRAEQLYESALEAAGLDEELERWFQGSADVLGGAAAAALLLRVARVQERVGRIDDAIATLWRAARDSSAEERQAIRARVRAIVEGHPDPEAQLAVLDRLVSEEPEPGDRASLRVDRATLLAERLGRASEATEELERARREAILTEAALGLLARLYADTGRPADQAGVLEELAERLEDPEARRRVRLQLSDLLASRLPDAARRILTELFEERPGDGDVFRRLSDLLASMGDETGLREVLRRRMDQPGLESEERIAIALRLAPLEAPADAAHLLASLRSEERTPALDLALADAYREAGQADAELELATACAIAPSTGAKERDGWMHRIAAALGRTGMNPEERLRRLDQVLQIAPDSAPLLMCRMKLLSATGPAEELASAIERCLDADALPQGAPRREAIRTLTRLAEGPRGRPAAALERLERELGRDPEIAPLVAGLTARVEDPATHVRVLEPLVKSPPRGYTPAIPEIRRLGLGLYQTGRRMDARPHLGRVLDSNPRDLEVVRACEAIAREFGRPQERLEWLARRFELEPPDKRLSVVREALSVAESEGDGLASLRWLRAWERIDRLPHVRALKWLDLERTLGTAGGELRAVRAVRDRTDHPRGRGQLWVREAELLERMGELDLASQAWAEAARASPQVEPDVLEAWERSLRDPRHDGQRVHVLEQLAGHAAVPPEERARYGAERAELLARDPDRREEAALELRRLFGVRTGATPEERRIWGSRLLALYRTLGLAREWCEVAEELLPIVPESERPSLERLIARELQAMGASERATAAWERVLEGSPEDEEALRASARLLEEPGNEAQRAGLLERIAELAVGDAGAILLEAARVRWQVLGEAEGAFRSLERCRALDPDRPGIHELRVEVGTHLGHDREVAASLEVLLTRAGADPSPERWASLASVIGRYPDLRPQAGDAADRALAGGTPGPELLRAVRRALEEAGDWDRVSRILGREAEASPDQAPALLRRLARVEWGERRDASATCVALEALAERDALTVEDRELLADALAAQGRWADSLSVRERSLEMRGPGVPPEAWLELAQAYLEHLDDTARAATACDSALERDPACIEALRLRADLDSRLADAAAEIARRETLASLLPDRVEAARELARAGALQSDDSAGLGRARALFRQALASDPACLTALIGAGELAFQQSDWEEAEDCLARAYAGVEGTPLATRLPDLARTTAAAAAERGRDVEALAHLDVSLEAAPDDPESLDLGATIALRVGAWQRAATLLERALQREGTDPESRTQALLRLARARDGLADRPGAAAALEEAAQFRPDDTALRARLVDLFVDLDAPVKAISHLDAWASHVGDPERADVRLRAARLTLQQGERQTATLRLEALVADTPGHADAWGDLVSRILEDSGPKEALSRVDAALAAVPDPHRQGRLLTLRARALQGVGRAEESAAVALEAVEADPTEPDAARLLAQHIGRTGEWRRAAHALEQALDVARMPPVVEAEILDAVGRLWAGPLADLERADRAYRRALECNPELDRAREALADVTSFDPSAHPESLKLHMELLSKFPGRRASWNALERIAAHWKRTEAVVACRWVVAALEDRPSPEGAGAVLSAVRPAPEVEAALALLHALAGDPRPDGSGPPRTELPLPEPLAAAMQELCGELWRLSDEELGRELVRAAEERDSTERRLRKRVRDALRGVAAECVAGLDPSVWREDLLCVAAAHAAATGDPGPRETLATLVRLCEATAGAVLGSGADLAEVSQRCPPARRFLLKLASEISDRLGLR